MKRLLMLLAVAAGFIAGAWSQDQAGDAEGRKALMKVCTGCHKIEMVTSRRATKEQWRQTIQAMIDKGADGTEEQFNTVLEYLAKNYGPLKGAPSEPTAKLNVNKADAKQLASFLEIPDSEAAAIVKYRDGNGPFKDWSDLKHVPGLNIKRIEAKKDRLAFE